MIITNEKKNPKKKNKSIKSSENISINLRPKIIEESKIEF